MALSLGFPLILQFLVMEKEENIKHLLEVNGMRVGNYWLSTFVFFFTYLCLGTTIFFLFGKLILDDGLFQKVSFIEITLFIILWNANQVVLSLVISAFINSSGTANAIGFVVSMVLNNFYAMINLNVYPYPAKLPMLFKVIPISLLSRMIIFLNLRGSDSVIPIEEEDNFENQIFLIGSILIYGIIGVIINEPRVRQWLKGLLGMLNGPDFSIYDEEFDRIHESAKSEWRLLASMNENEAKAHIIVCKNVKKFFVKKDNYFPALKGLNLKIERNEVFGLLGPNGAGKTTLISIITNFLNQDHGEVLIDGLPLGSQFIKEKTSFCPQFDIQWGILSVYEHLRIFGLLKGISGTNLEKQIKDILESVCLTDEKDQIVDTLSGGMRRRCSLAMSLIGDITIVFLDEPTTGLDPKKRREFWNLIMSQFNKKTNSTRHLL